MYKVIRIDEGQGGQGPRTLVGYADDLADVSCMRDADRGSIDWEPIAYEITREGETDEKGV